MELWDSFSYSCGLSACVLYVFFIFNCTENVSNVPPGVRGCVVVDWLCCLCACLSFFFSAFAFEHGK